MLKHAKVYGSGPDKVGGPDWDADHVVDDAAALRAALGVAQDGPRFRAYTNTATGVASATTTQVPLEVESFDSSNAFNTTTYRFQPAVAGYYDIKWSVALASSASALILIVGLIYKNGAEYSRMHVPPTATSNAWVQGGDIVHFNGSTDYIDLRVYGVVTSGSLVVGAGAAGTWLAGHYIGA